MMDETTRCIRKELNCYRRHAIRTENAMRREVRNLRSEVDERLHSIKEREKRGVDLFAPVRDRFQD